MDADWLWRQLADVSLHRRLARLASLVIIVLIGHATAKWVWMLTPSLLTVSNTMQAPAFAVEENTETLLPIRRYTLFGTPQITAPPPQRTAPVARPSVAVTGIVYTGRNASSTAFLVVNGQSNVYSVGDTIDDTSGALVYAIKPQAVDIAFGNDIVSLPLNDNDLLSGVANNRRSTTIIRRRDDGPVQSTIIQSADNSARVILPEEVIPRIRTLQQQLRSSPTAFLSLINVRPFQNGNIRGLSLQPGSDVQLFGQLGLQPGDVLLSVNGMDVNTPENAYRIFQQVIDTTASQLNMTVLRGDKTTPIQVQLR